MKTTMAGHVPFAACHMNPKFKAWLRAEKKMVPVKSMLWLDDGRIVVHTNDNIKDYLVGVDCDLMQSTGLKDCKGVEIFEGDIVEWDDDSKGRYWRVAVVEINPSLRFRIVKNTKHKLSCAVGEVFEYGNFIYKETEKYISIIGNRFANPELIGG